MESLLPFHQKPRGDMQTVKLIALAKAVSRNQNIWVRGTGANRLDTMNMINSTYIGSMMDHRNFARYGYAPFSLQHLEGIFTEYDQLLVCVEALPPEEYVHLFTVFEF